MAASAEVTARVGTLYGNKFIVDGLLHAPSGTAARVRSIWIIDRESDAPRLVTAYPRG